MQKNILLIIVILLFTQCQQPQDSINEHAAKQSLIATYFATFNTHNWEQLSGFYADSAMLKDPAFGLQPITQSKADIKKKYEQLQQSIPDVHDSVVKIYMANEHVIVEFLSKGTAPDGKPFALPICTIFGFKDGKIVEDFTYYDNF